MKTIFLVSHLQNYHKDNEGRKIPCQISDNNYLITNLKRKCIGFQNLVFVACEPDDCEKNNQKLQILVDSLKLSGMEFAKVALLDSRNEEQTSTLINQSDLVYLAGGHTYEGMQFFDKIQLKEVLGKYAGVVIGVSAGAINLAKDVFNSPEKFEYYAEPLHYEGLGLVDINIRAHFQKDSSKMDSEAKARREIDLANSFSRTIYGIEDGSYILLEDEHYTLFGQGYIMKNFHIKPIGGFGQKYPLELDTI